MGSHIFDTVELRGRVLDVGAGGSGYLKSASEYSNDFEITRLDIAPRDADVIRGSIEDLPFDGGYFQQVLCFNVLEHVFHSELALSEVRRVLGPGGTLYGYVPFMKEVHADPDDFWRFTRSALERSLSESGFDDVQVVTDGGFGLVITEHLLYLISGRRSASVFSRALRVAVSLTAVVSSHLIGKLMGAGKRKSSRERWPLGYFFVGKVPEAKV